MMRVVQRPSLPGRRSGPVWLGIAGNLDVGAWLAALVTAAVAILGFAYPWLANGAVPLSRYLTGLNVALLYSVGVMSACGLIVAVGCRLASLAITMFFCFVFFFIAVREQVLGSFDIILEDQAIVKQSLLLCLVFVLIVLVINLVPRQQSWGTQLSEALPVQPRPQATLSLVVVACCALQLVLIARLGRALLSSRGELATAMLAAFGRAAGAMVANFAFSFCFILPVLAIVGCWRQMPPWARAVSIVALLLGCLINNPLVNARFFVGTLVIGTVLLIADPRRTGFALLVTCFATLAAPLLNVFRDLWAWQHVKPELGLASLRTFDFDAFTSIGYGLLYLRDYGSMHGSNILGSLLFFVPSAAWPGKPVYTGGLLYETVVHRFRLESPDNLSAPIPIEGFLAFGWAGIVALSLAYALLVRWLDSAPVAASWRERALSARFVCLAYAPVLLIFLMRGSLMPTFAYTTGIFSAVALAVLLLRAPVNMPPGSGGFASIMIAKFLRLFC